MEKYHFRIKTYASCLLINLGLIIMIYFIAPQLMNWPPHSENSAFQQAVGTMPHMPQFAIAYVFISLVVLIFVNSQYKNIFKLYEGKKIELSLHEVRQKSFSIASKLMIVQVLTVFLMALVVVIIIPHTIEAAVKMLLMYSATGLTGAVIIDFVLSPGLKKFVIWSSTHEENYTFNYKKKSFKKMLFLKITPLIILTIVFISFFGYASVIKENGYNNFKHYKNELSHLELDGLNVTQVQDKLKVISKLSDDEDFFFLKLGQETFIMENNREMSLFFSEYINFFVDEMDGRIFDSYGIERGGYARTVTLDSGEVIYIGINYTTSDIGVFMTYIVVFALLICGAITYLYLFINNVTTDINAVAKNLNKIASNEGNNLVEKISISSNDEIGEMIASYNKIQGINKNYVEQLNIAKEQADRANSAKTDFLSSMSHEIRTPLNAIVGFSQALAEECLNEQAQEEVNDIIMASNNLLEIVNGILDISKIEANKLEIVNIEYNINNLFKETITLAEAKLASKPLEFRVHIDPNVPPILYGDRLRIKQILLNLLTNSIKYTKEGFFSLTVSSIIRNDICRLIISVEDSGVGIKPEDIDKLFSKFQRFELEKNATTEGTGLGLAITKNLVELMGGKIIAQSIYGEGSKFTVSIDQRIIPKTADDLQDEIITDTSSFSALGQHILVVDDNKVNLKVANRLLRDYQVDIDLVSSGRECIDKILGGEKYDLILMDDMMPKMSGTEALKNLKKIVGFDTPVIALTANAITGMRERYLSLGFDDYIAKPIDRGHLNRILRKFLKENNDGFSYPRNLDLTQEIKLNIDEGVNTIKNASFLEENGIEYKNGIELLGDLETYEMTLEDFYDEIPSRMDLINKYKDNNDMPNYAIYVHAMKSDAKYLGCTRLAELSLNHETESKAGNRDFVNEHYMELVDEANRILQVIKKYLGR